MADACTATGRNNNRRELRGAGGGGFEMYASHVRLSHRPVTPAPNAEAYIPTGTLEQARQTLIRCLERGEGPALVIGRAAAGRSLWCNILTLHFRGKFQVAHLTE